MWVWLFWELGCGIGADGEAARAALDDALARRDPSEVGAAARAAAKWQGQDAALDHSLGDALANVAMRPEEGLPLLLNRPAPEDPGWVTAVQAAALRSGDRKRITEVWRAVGQAPPPLEEFEGDALLDQLAATARRDPTLGAEILEEALIPCTLLAGRPRSGRRALEMEAPRALGAAARALGANAFAMGRAPDPNDGDPLLGKGPLFCADLVVIPGDELPVRLPPRGLVVGASDGYSAIYLEIRTEQTEAWVFAASDPQAGARWLRAAALIQDWGEPEGTRRVLSELGVGLGPR